MTWRILELFSGLGAWRMAASAQGSVVAAYDISPVANRVYAATHGDRPIARELATVPAAELAAQGADTWLLSPPCQPYCRMGLHMDLADRRSRAFVRLVEVLGSVPVERLALENVEGFAGSEAHALLVARLDQLGFHHHSYRLCPSRFGIPNQRPRLFLVAARRPLKTLEPPAVPPQPLGDYLDAEEDPRLYLPAEVLSRHLPGLDLVTAASNRSGCFIGGYGQRYVGSGSFLRTERGIRRFSPGEIGRLMHLPTPLSFPEDLPFEGRYKLLGNALNVTVARWVLGAF